MIVPTQLGDKEKEMQAIEDVLDAYEPLIGEHSEVTFAELYDDEQDTETKDYGYRFFINMSDTHFKKAKRLWRFFDALFRTIQDQNQLILIYTRCGFYSPNLISNFNKHTDFSQHYPYQEKRRIKGGLLPTFLDFGIKSEDIGEFVDSLFEYNDHGMKRSEDKRPSYDLSKMYNFKD